MWRYYLLALSTAPGVAVHEIGHLLFCWFARVKIHRVSLFRFGQTAGYVVHDEPQCFYESLLISCGPLMLNSLVAMFFFALLNFQSPKLLHVLYLWLGIAIGLHAIPSHGDADTLFSTTNRKIWRNPLALISYPIVLFLHLLNFLKRWHVHFLYVIVLFWLGHWYLKG